MTGSFSRGGAAPMLAMLALVLCAGCEVVSAQAVFDAGTRARADASSRIARDGGVRRPRVDAAVADIEIPRDAGPRRARRDAGPRRARRDAGAQREDDAGTLALDGGTSLAFDAGTSLALEAGVGSLAERDAPFDASVAPEADFDAALAADAGDVSEARAPDAGDALALDAAVVLDAAATIDAAVAPDAAMHDDAGALPAQLPDAGVPSSVADAGATSAVGPAPPSFDPWELLARLRGDHDDDRAPAGPSIAPLPGVDAAIRERLETLVPALPSGRASMFALLVLLLGAVLIARTLGRMRRALPARGVIPRTLAIAHGLTRLAIAMLVLASIAELLPDWTRSALPWVVVACAVALGWSARDLLPDLVAGAVLLTERRVSRGQHLVVAGHDGVVVDVGIRVTTLRDIGGRELRVPNRIVLSSPTTTRRSTWHAVTVRVRAPHGASSDAFARALREAVLLSPWVPLPSVAEIARDPGEFDAFEVRTTLLDLRFEARFRGELLARAEAVLRAERTKASVSETPP